MKLRGIGPLNGNKRLRKKRIIHIKSRKKWKSYQDINHHRNELIVMLELN